MHRLLKRQINKYISKQKLEGDFRPFIKAIDEAYQQNERDVEIIERSLNLASEELSERNELLRLEVEKQQAVQLELGQSLAALNATFDATGEAILAISAEGQVTKYNKMAEMLILSDGNFSDINDDKRLITNSVPEELDEESQPEISLAQFRNLFKQVVDFPLFMREIRQVGYNPLCELFGQVTLKNGHIFEYHSSPQLKNGELLGRVWCFRDITELKKNEAIVHHQAFHDALTNLPNRALLDDRLEHAIHCATRFQTQLAVLFIDLDDFKKVNDNAGHHAGDIVLKEVTRRIKTCIREVDTLSRLGGDEFVVLLENLKSHSTSTNISHRIIDELALPFVIDDNEYYISSSIGISMFPKDGEQPDELMRKADMAMYHAKSVGKSNHQYFDSELERSSVQLLKIENELREAIQDKEFSLYYQPKVDLATNKVTTLEALIRWFRPDGRFISPEDFIPVAEQTGLINEVGKRVLNEICRHLVEWKKQGIETLPIAINVSPVEFRNKYFVSQFLAIIESFKLSPSSFEIEITESLFLDNIEQAQRLLTRLREEGVTVAVDDFGTGYSSLQYLHQLPIDVLKIDRSFIMELDSEPHNAAIADSIITLGHNLNLKIVAEGIENKESLRFLRERGCDLGQGFYLYKPMPHENVTQLLLKNSKV